MKSHKNKITVLYVDQAVAFGGSVVVVGYLVNALDRSIFRAVVVGSMPPSNLKHLISNDTSLYIVPSYYNYARWERTVNAINILPSKLLRKLFIYIFSVFRSIVNSIYLFHLARILIKEKIDIVHINNGMTNVEAIIAAKLTGCKYVVHLHQIKYHGLVQRLLIKTVPKFIAISDFIKTEMTLNSIPESRTVVIKNPVKPRTLQQKNINTIRAKYKLTDNDLIFGIVGRIVKWKGHEEFLKAAKIVLNSIPNSKALIVGDFSDGDINFQTKIIGMVNEYGLQDRIIFTGYVKDVENMYSIMDVFVHASIDPEPFGLVITEAMSYGIPVIAADSGAPKEIISDGETGYLVDPYDNQKLAAVLITLLSNYQLRRKIGENGKALTLEKYQVESYARAIEDVYLDVLGRTR